MQLQEPADTGEDAEDGSVRAEQLIEELDHSRQLLSVIEYDNRLFDEHCHTHNAQFSRDVAGLTARRETAEAAISASEGDDTGFLRDLFVRMGRPQHEALAYGKLSVPQVKGALQRKALYLKRGLDLQTFRRVHTRRQHTRTEAARRELERLGHEKAEAGDTAFKDNAANTLLNRLARETRQLIQGIHGTMVYIDLIADVGNKFTRVKEYLADDANRFEKALNSLQERTKLQQKEMVYLAKVFSESSRAKERAETSFASTSEEMRHSEQVRDEMLRDVQAALEEHKAICRQCVEHLVTLNTSLKANADACFFRCDPAVKPFPHALPAMRHRPDSKRPAATSLPAHTELQRAYDTLLDLTQAGSAKEMVRAFREQARKAQSLHSTGARLDHLLQTVLRPEFDRFEREQHMLEARTGARHDTLLRTIDHLQEDYHAQADAAGDRILEQRNNVDEFSNFLEVMFALNQRIAQLNHTVKADATYLQQHPGLDGLLDLTATNVQSVVGQIPEYFQKEWGALRQLVNDADYLQYRERKLPEANNRIVFDSAPAGRRSTPVFNDNFLTNAQLKEANMAVVERARQAELERLRAADVEAEREKAHRDKMAAAHMEKKPARKKH